MGKVLKMPEFRVVFPCGYERVISNTNYIKGMKHNGKRPIELHITGEIEDMGGMNTYAWQSNILHPRDGIMTHNGKSIYFNGRLVDAAEE